MAGRPIVDIGTVVYLIGSKKLSGLEINAHTDFNIYGSNIKVNNYELDDIDIERLDPYPLWNYIIHGFKSDRIRLLGATLRTADAASKRDTGLHR